MNIAVGAALPLQLGCVCVGAEEAVLPALVLPPGAVEAQQRSDSEIEDLLETSEASGKNLF